ncbi:MAG: TonB-dependent receptor [Acidobacteria bacterium]|nr:TonB-dependent receptor [Acidobacteriota bacterium]
MRRVSFAVVALLVGHLLSAGLGARSSSGQDRPPAAAVGPVAQTPPLTGVIVDPQGRPVAGVALVLSDGQGERAQAATGADGAFSLTAGLPKRGRLRVTARGFAPVDVPLTSETPVPLQIRLKLAGLSETVTVRGAADTVRARVERAYDETKAVASLDGEVAASYNPMANHASLRLLPGVIDGGGSGRDRFGTPSNIRGGAAWGVVETVDEYPAINITPVSAEDGGYTASFSSIIPSIALRSIGVSTGGLGVSYGQASGGVVRNRLKSGTIGVPETNARVELLSLGEGILMADHGGGQGNVDYYVAAQTSLADYGNAYETFPRAIQNLALGSGLVKLGVRTSPRGRWELFYVGGGERHEYAQVTGSGAAAVRHDYHTDKANHFLATRYDWRPQDNFVVGVGVTQNWFRENRVEDAAAGATIDVSRRNRPQRATHVFANADWQGRLGERVAYSSSAGLDLTWDRFEDVTTKPIRFEFGEQALYWRNAVTIGRRLTLTGGLRLANVDNGFRTDARLLYEAGAAVTVPGAETKIYGSWSTGYKLNKAFYLWWGGGNFIAREPANGLVPSSTETAEIGIEQPVRMGDRTGTVRVSTYLTHEDDLFNFGNSGSGVPFYDDARTRGVEVWTEWRLGFVRPFASLTWLRSTRDSSTNPAATNVDLRFSPLPNWVSGAGAAFDLHERLALSVFGTYNDGGVSEALVGDDILVTRFGGYGQVNAAAEWRAGERWSLVGRLENLLNDRKRGYDRTTFSPDGRATLNPGTQIDPGLVAAIGVQVKF